jgi:predicted transcriptional regulator
MTAPDTLSRRERQIMDVLYARGLATAAEVRQALPDAPSYSAVRALLRILEEKGHARHEQQGPRYVYLPQVSRDRARRSAMRKLTATFFEGSAVDAAAAFINSESLSKAELARLQSLIDRARREER